MPIRTSFSGFSPVILSPIQLTTPDVGLLRPDKARRSVVLPAPLEPIIAASVPVGTAIDT